jgi:hypothetical protein
MPHFVVNVCNHNVWTSWWREITGWWTHIERMCVPAREVMERATHAIYMTLITPAAANVRVPPTRALIFLWPHTHMRVSRTWLA